ncbi:transcriptional regulator with XRE-family HTH domain [Sphingomonas oligoaromativorans]|nr:transcriptional regulator with XRE-family HTH domain [Sphingomonas oligoaromativorans]
MVAALNTRRYRTALGLSQEAVGERIGADQQYVSVIERGGQNLTLIRLLELAEALNVRPAQLLDEDYAESAQTHRDQGS